MNNTEILAKELNISLTHAENVVKLLDDGNTVPFISRYRKEMTGSMDDQTIRELSERLTYLRNLDKRREEIISSIESQGKLTDELKDSVMNASTLAELEDIYRPYKQKRRTRATIAKEKGLEPLAEILFAQELKEGDIYEIANEYVDPEKKVNDENEALAGASDIIAEIISDMADVRKDLRELFLKSGVVQSKAAKEEDSVYSMYYDFSEGVAKIQPHRILAINRGEREEFLKVSVNADTDAAMRGIFFRTIKPGSISSAFVREAARDAYDRLIYPSVEREIRSFLTDNANEQAIKMFGTNLKPLLMQPPVKNKVTLGLDPAYRTGCKIAVVDGTGKVLDTAVIYPTPPHNKTEEAKKILKNLIHKHNVEVISIGNGTASKESEIFVADLLHEESGVSYMVVNEAGASVYSASKLGAAEFPDYDVSLRSAVSIARRLQDPLAELVKIDPKSIGVGQYQHDMPAARLDESLDGVVEDCVNSVGVDLNTASPSLLAHVSGLSATTAKNIAAYREEHGAFKNRKTLTKVPKLGPKAFEQCAGFLRVPESDEILDNTSVHPESYVAAKKLLELCGFDEADVKNGNLSLLPQKAKEIGDSRLAEELGVGVPTIHDIISELQKPGRDPRDELPPPMLRTDVMDMKDLKPGMTFKGTVRNVIDFGVFVDIGVHQDGLVHISEVCDRFIKHPGEVLRVGQVVNVVVLNCDAQKKRISLSIKQASKAEGTL